MDDFKQQTTKLISQSGGQIDAMLAVLYGICQSIDPNSPVAQHIQMSLEQMYAQKLQGVTNQEYFDGLDQTAEVLREALQFQQAD